MLNLAEYRKKTTALCDYLPWACLIGPGIVLNKDGSFQRTLRYRGPDLDSATEAELVSITARLNNVLKRFGDGWALFFEAERVPANQYPGARFADAASWLVDQERYAAFSADGAHHESRYCLTFLYLPPPDREGRAQRLIYERTEGEALEPDAHAQLEYFRTETDRALELLSAILPEAEALGDAETLAYLHGTISNRRHPIAVPPIPAHLDAILCDTPLLGGIEPKLGDQHLRVLTVLGFPNATTPGLLDALNDLGFSYRWVTRWISQDKTQATKTLTRLRRQWFAKRKSVGAILREVMFNRESALVDPDADNKALDAQEALEELGADDVAFGHLTTVIVVSDSNAGRCRREAAGGRAHRQRPRLRHHPRDLECRGSLARLAPRQPLRQRAPAHRAHPEPRAHDAGVGGVGRTRDEPAPRCAAADDGGDAREHAVPARSARRRRRAHPGRRPDRSRQVRPPLPACPAVPPLHRRPGDPVRPRAIRARRHAGHGRSQHRARPRRDAVAAAAGTHRRARRDRLRPAVGDGAAHERGRAGSRPT